MDIRDIFKDNKEINVVFLGGSITQGAGSSSVDKCFANRTGEWFKETFGADRVNYYNKGVGGTPSAYGLLRFGRDVADLNPHIVFVEFAVNDNGRDTRKFTESIVRSLASLPTKPYVAFLYTTDAKYTTNTAYFEEVAKHYKIAQISLKDALKKHLDGADALEAGYLKDNVHPCDSGYDVYYHEMVRCLSDSAYYTVPDLSAEKIVPDSMSVSTYFIPLTNAEKSSGWVSGGSGERQSIIGAVGEWVEFEFDGNILAFEHGLDDNCAAYDVYIDGEKAGNAEPYWRNFMNYQLVLGFNTFDLPSGHHKVRLEVVNSENEGRTNKDVLIYNAIAGTKN